MGLIITDSITRCTCTYTIRKHNKMCACFFRSFYSFLGNYRCILCRYPVVMTNKHDDAQRRSVQMARLWDIMIIYWLDGMLVTAYWWSAETICYDSHWPCSVKPSNCLQQSVTYNEASVSTWAVMQTARMRTQHGWTTDAITRASSSSSLFWAGAVPSCSALIATGIFTFSPSGIHTPYTHPHHISSLTGHASCPVHNVHTCIDSWLLVAL